MSYPTTRTTPPAGVTKSCDRVLCNRLLCGIAAAACLMPTALAAQSRPPAGGSAVQLEEISVVGERANESPTGPVDGYVAKRTLTGSKTDTPLIEVPQSVSVIGREQMDDQAVQKTDEALRYTAGVYAQPFGPDSDTNWLFIRGFQATQTGVYQDGLQLYSYGFGGFFVDSSLLERIEVLRGAASVLYGGSNPGGLVNYVSKHPTGERLRSMEAGINDAGKGYIGFDLGDKAGNDFAYRVTGRIIGGKDYTEFAEGFRGTVSPSLTWRPDNQNTLTVLANYTHFDEVHGGGGFLPYVGTVVDAPFGRIRRKANFTEPSLDYYDRRQASIGYEYEHRFNNDWAFRQNLRFGHAEISEHSLYAFGYNGFSTVPTDATNSLTRINFRHDTQVNSLTTDNQLQGKVQIGPVEHTVLLGTDYKLFDMDQMQASTSGTLISADNPVYGAAQGTPVPYIDQNLRQSQLGFYVQDQMRFGGGWIVTLNGRRDDVNTKAVGLPSYEGDAGAWSGRAGIAYKFANGLVPYASVSTFFNPLFGTSPVVGAFKPESGKQYEVGLKYSPTWIDGIFTVALFDLTKRNVVTGLFNAETQLGAVNSRGIELEGQVNVTRNLKALGSFTALKMEITEDYDPTVIGKMPYIVPKMQAALGLDYTYREGALAGVSVGGGVRYVGASWVDNQNTLQVPAATVFDAKIGYKKDNWGVTLNASNLFDKAYVASCQTQLSCGYAEGRVLRLKANITW